MADQPQRTVVQHLDALRSLFTSIDPAHRASLNAFWRDVRQSINDQDDVISQLRNQLQQPQIPAPSTPARPHTSNSVDVIRDAVSQALLGASRFDEDASNTVEEIYNLDPQWALAFIQRQKNILISNSHELGCWMSGNAAAHANGYVKMNMRGTRNPLTGQNFTVQPFGHQMGIVAGGNGIYLRSTSDGSYHVSHLCHNTACFNPEHLVIESEAENKARNDCHNSFILKCLDKTVIHPCTHWRGDLRLQCILPMRSLKPNMQGKWLDMGPSGPIIRTGSSHQ